MTKTALRLLLASTSPRRRELLDQIGIPFEAISPGVDGVDETPLPGEDPAQYVERLAIQKARAGWTHALELQKSFDAVLGADTTVTIDHHLLEKPLDAADARRMLELLSGRTHTVMTALCLKTATHEASLVSTSYVTFKTLTSQDISDYIESKEPFGKAGAYGIQGRAACFIEHLEGSYSGVMGLPLFELGQLLDRNTTP